MYNYFYWLTLCTAALVAGESLILAFVMLITDNRNWKGYKNGMMTFTDVIISGAMLYFLLLRPSGSVAIPFLAAVVVGFFSHGSRVGEILMKDKKRFFFTTPLAISCFVRMGCLLAVFILAIILRATGA